jgi:Spy/CpxP family protein refolding chaperone
VGGLLFATNTSQRHSPKAAPGEGHASKPSQPSNWTGSEDHVREICRRMSKELGLSDEQSTKVQALVRESQVRMKAINDGMWPEIRDEMRRFRDEVRLVLTPEQQTKFDEINKRRAEQRNRRSGSRPPGPGVPGGAPADPGAKR